MQKIEINTLYKITIGEKEFLLTRFELRKLQAIIESTLQD